jgi:hypothetical protein
MKIIINLARMAACILALGLLSSCADRATGSQFTGIGSLTAGQGKIVIYRPTSSHINQGASPYVYVNGKKRDLLKVDGYLVYEVPGGDHHVEVKNFWSWNVPLDLDVTVPSGKAVYLRLWTESEFMSGHYYLAEVPEAVAQKELGEMRSLAR